MSVNHSYSVEQLRDRREYLAEQLAWAKKNKLWLLADRYLSELDTVNIQLAQSSATGD